MQTAVFPIFIFSAGLLSFLSPCIVPMVTVYLSLITGMTFEQLAATTDKSGIRRDLLVNTLLFVLGFGVIFTLAGGASGLVGSFFSKPTLLEKIGGIFVILFGLHLSGLFKIPYLKKLSLAQRLKLERKPVGHAGAFLVGIFFALVCSHCIGPTLYSMLIYAGTTRSSANGMIIMALFSLGLAVPYLVTALAVGPIIDRLDRAKRYLWIVSLVSGLLLVGFGVLMLAGQFTQLTGFFSRLLPYRLPTGMR